MNKLEELKIYDRLLKNRTISAEIVLLKQMVQNAIFYLENYTVVDTERIDKMVDDIRGKIKNLPH